jgi:hypothetical protein
VPIRVKGKTRAITILVDLVKLIDLLTAHCPGRAAGPSQEPVGLGPTLSQESA